MCRWSGGTVVLQRSQCSSSGTGSGGFGFASPRSPEIISALRLPATASSIGFTVPP